MNPVMLLATIGSTMKKTSVSFEQSSIILTIGLDISMKNELMWICSQNPPR